MKIVTKPTKLSKKKLGWGIFLWFFSCPAYFSDWCSNFDYGEKCVNIYWASPFYIHEGIGAQENHALPFTKLPYKCYAFKLANIFKLECNVFICTLFIYLYTLYSWLHESSHWCKFTESVDGCLISKSKRILQY